MQLFFLREGGFVSLESFWILVSYKIALGRAVSGLVNAIRLQPAWDKFLREEVRHFGILRLGVIVDV